MIQAQSRIHELFVPSQVRYPGLNRPQGRLSSRGALQALGLALLLVVPLSAQSRPTPPSLPTLPSGAPVGALEDRDIPSLDPVERARQLRAFNAERQKSMVSDTNKLLKLARELDEEVNSTKPDSLTAAQLRKVAEIEKLARSVKEKMSASARGVPTFPGSLSPQFR